MALIRHGDEKLRVWYERLVGKEGGGTWEYLMRLACLGYDLIKSKVLVLDILVKIHSIGVNWRCLRDDKGGEASGLMHDLTIYFLYYEVGVGWTKDAYQYVRLFLYYSCYVFDIVWTQDWWCFIRWRRINSSAASILLSSWWELCLLLFCPSFTLSSSCTC